MDEDYAAMTDQELGFYHRCLNRSWLNNGLPGDLNELARLLGRTRPYLDKVWKRVGRKFELRDARLVNGRQEKERTTALAKSFQSSAAVAERERKRKEPSSDDAAAGAKPIIEQSSDDTSRDALRASDYVSDGVVVEVSLEERKQIWFDEEFWPHFWLKKGKTEACTAFKKAATSEERKDFIVAAMHRQLPEMLTKSPDKRKYAQGWLNQGRFNDELEMEAPYYPAPDPKANSPQVVAQMLENFRGIRGER